MVKHSTILFDKKRRASHGRLHVGYRFSDWSKVWYQPTPDAEADSDGTIDAALFSFAEGPPQRREPMMGIVSWLPHFDVTIRHCQSSKSAERERMQLQMLHDAWLYMNEDDPDQLRELEESLDQQRDPKWQSWFNEAKKYKEGKKRGHQKNLAARTNAVRAAGLNPADIDIGPETSEDEAYHTDEGRSGRFARDKSMGPPVAPNSGVRRDNFGSRPVNTPQPRSGKRSGVGNGPKNNLKKPKNTSGNNPRARGVFQASVTDDEADDEDYTMSGGSNGLDSEAPRTTAGGASDRPRLFGQELFSNKFGSRPLNGALDRTGEDHGTTFRTGRRSSLFDPSPPVPFSPSGPTSRNGPRGASSRETGILPDAEPTGLDDATAQEVNGGMGEAAAFRTAMRASQQPEPRPLHGESGEDGAGQNGTGENEG